MLGRVLTEEKRFGALVPFIRGLAQPVEVVAPLLAKRILANTRTGVKLRPFGPLGLWVRVLLAPLRAKPITFRAE